MSTILITAGGTGGHMFPAIAVAEAAIAKGHKILFITDKRAAKYLDKYPNITKKIIFAASPSGGIFKKLKGTFLLGLGFIQSLFLLLCYKPSQAYGFGGYPSFPALLAAKVFGKRIILHEQNAVFGRANKVLAKWASKIATSFADTKNIPTEFANKVTHTGNPVRAEIIALHNKKYQSPEDKINLLILGGSLGSKIFNNIPAALQLLPDELKSMLVITHQVRAENIDKVNKAYKDIGIKANTASFFDNMPDLLTNTHIMIARSGASTVAENLVAGIPSIFVPLKIAMDNHQQYNAEYVVNNAGGAMILESEYTTEILALKLQVLLEQDLLKISSNMQNLAILDSANQILS